MRRCLQTECMFNNTPLCPSCDCCEAPSNLVDENCDKCWNCEHDINEIRGSSGFRKGNKITIFDKGKVIVLTPEKMREEIMNTIR